MNNNDNNKTSTTTMKTKTKYSMYNKMNSDNNNYHNDTTITYSKSKNNNGNNEQKKKKFRWIILSLCCIVITTLYYSFDIATVLHQQLKDYMTSSTSSSSSNIINNNDNDKNNFEYKYNLLFVTYSLPNIILPIMGGTLITETGSASKCIVLFSSFVFLGHVIFSIGLYNKSWFIIYLGRFIYGIGGENLFVAQSTIIAQWFGTTTNNNNKDIALAFGISSSISWLGGILNDWITPIIANRISIFIALFIGCIVLLFGFISSLLIYYIDEHIIIVAPNPNSNNNNDDDDDIIEIISNNNKKSYNYIDSVIINDDIIIDGGNQFNDEDDNSNNVSMNESHQKQKQRNNVKEETECYDIKDDDNNGIHTFTMNDDDDNNQQQNNYYIPTIPKFTSLFWIICICYIFVEGSILMFDNIASGILMERSYFIIIDDYNGCHLPYDNQCTSGTLQKDKNDHVLSNNDSNNMLCNTINNNPNIAPIIPKSIRYYVTTNNTTIEEEWWKSNYTYDYINPKKDINCNDPFWYKSCTANYCIKQSIATERTGRAMSIPYIISSIFVPIFGYISDHHHCNCNRFITNNISCLGMYLLLAPIILFIVHCMLAFSTISPFIPLCGQGIACALYVSAIWPAIPKSINIPSTQEKSKKDNSNNIGLAYGIITSLLNASLVIFPIITSFIYTNNVSNDDSYIPNVEIFFIVCAFIGIISGIVLNFGIKDSYYYLSS